MKRFFISLCVAACAAPSFAGPALVEVHQVYRSEAEVSWLDSTQVVKEGDAWFLDIKGEFSGVSEVTDKLKEHRHEVTLVLVPELNFSVTTLSHAYRLVVALPQTSPWPLRPGLGGASLLMPGTVPFSARLRLPNELAGFYEEAPLRLDLAGDRDAIGENASILLKWNRATKGWSLQYGATAPGPFRRDTANEIRIERYGVPVDSLQTSEVKLVDETKTLPVFRLAGTYRPRTCPGDTEAGPLAVQGLRGESELGLSTLHQGAVLDPWGVTCQLSTERAALALESEILETYPQRNAQQTVKLINTEVINNQVTHGYVLRNALFYFLTAPKAAGEAWKMQYDGVRFEQYP